MTETKVAVYVRKPVCPENVDYPYTVCTGCPWAKSKHAETILITHPDIPEQGQPGHAKALDEYKAALLRYNVSVTRTDVLQIEGTEGKGYGKCALAPPEQAGCLFVCARRRT